MKDKTLWNYRYYLCKLIIPAWIRSVVSVSPGSMEHSAGEGGQALGLPTLLDLFQIHPGHVHPLLWDVL